MKDILQRLNLAKNVEQLRAIVLFSEQCTDNIFYFMQNIFCTYIEENRCGKLEIRPSLFDYLLYGLPKHFNLHSPL